MVVESSCSFGSRLAAAHAVRALQARCAVAVILADYQAGGEWVPLPPAPFLDHSAWQGGTCICPHQHTMATLNNCRTVQHMPPFARNLFDSLWGRVDYLCECVRGQACTGAFRMTHPVRKGRRGGQQWQRRQSARGLAVRHGCRTFDGSSGGVGTAGICGGARR